MNPILRRTLLWGIPAVLAVGGIAGYRMAVAELKRQVESALGPESRIESIGVGFTGVTVSGLRIGAPDGWPVNDALRADRVTITPSLAAALVGKLRVSSITVTAPYLSVLRTPDEKIRLLPSLLEKASQPSASTGAAPEVSIGRIVLRDGAVDFFDASVQNPALKISLRQMELTVNDLSVPGLTGRTSFDFNGVLKGTHHDGRVEMQGWADIGSRDSSIKTRLHAVDLVALQPYLIRAAETGVETGVLDFEIQSEVRDRQLTAPGRIMISDLKLSSASGSFMGMPRQAVLFFLKDKDGRIAVDFTLAGDINNPSFSLNEMFATQIAAAIANAMGVSLSGVAEALGTAGQRGAAVLDDAARGVNSALKGLLGGTDSAPEEKNP